MRRKKQIIRRKRKCWHRQNPYHVQLNLYYTSSQDISSTVKKKIKLAGYLYLTDDILFQLK